MMMLRGVYEVLEAASTRAFGEVHIDGGRDAVIARRTPPAPRAHRRLYCLILRRLHVPSTVP